MARRHRVPFIIIAIIFVLAILVVVPLDRGVLGSKGLQLGLDLKARCAIPNTFVFGYCNKTFGYFPTVNAAWEGGYGGREATLVEVGAGERFVTKTLANLYYQTDRLHKVPQF